MDTHLLPSNATAFERAASEAMDHFARLGSNVSAIRTAKMGSIPDSFIPYLIYEYGLGPVSAYVTDQRYLLSAGIDWQRVRGTPDAIARALGWLGYMGTLEEADVARLRWNLFQIGLDRVRDHEAPDLENIEGVVSLSVPVRSQFYRGFNGYDVRELVWSRRRYSGAMWGSSSGARLRPGGAKWSFGRRYDFDLDMSRTDLVALGAWQDLPGGVSEGWGLRFSNTYNQGQSTWGDYTWDSTDATWDAYSLGARAALIAGALADRPVWAAFRRADNSVIGYRRARVARPVVGDALGPYQVGALRLSPSGIGDSFYVDAQTGFGDGDGSTAASVSLLFDATPTDPAAPGILWAAPGLLTGGTEVVKTPIAIQFGKTVRERVRFHLTF